MNSRHLLALAIVAASSSAAAGDSLDPPDRARVLSDEGRAYHADGKYDRAIGSFKAAYELAPSPGLLFNLAQAYRLKGDCTNAATMYRSYLRSEPDRPHRELARSHLDTVETCVSRRAKLQPLIGTHGDQVAADRGGATTTGTLAIDQPKAPGRTLKRTGAAIAIGGGVLMGVGVYYAVQSADYSAQVAQMYADGEKWKDIEPVDARGRRASKLATWFAIGGGAVALTGGALYLAGRREAARAESKSISITPAPGGGQVNVAWTW